MHVLALETPDVLHGFLDQVLLLVWLLRKIELGLLDEPLKEHTFDPMKLVMLLVASMAHIVVGASLALENLCNGWETVLFVLLFDRI